MVKTIAMEANLEDEINLEFSVRYSTVLLVKTAY